MDVLELPRPVINFLRTMAKESCRYALSWDIFGGPDSVTLTLTWKLIDDEPQSSIINETPPSSSKQQQQPIYDDPHIRSRSTAKNNTLSSSPRRSRRDENTYINENASVPAIFRSSRGKSVEGNCIQSNKQMACQHQHAKDQQHVSSLERPTIANHYHHHRQKKEQQQQKQASAQSDQIYGNLYDTRSASVVKCATISSLSSSSPSPQPTNNPPLSIAHHTHYQRAKQQQSITPPTLRKAIRPLANTTSRTTAIPVTSNTSSNYTKLRRTNDITAHDEDDDDDDDDALDPWVKRFECSLEDNDDDETTEHSEEKETLAPPATTTENIDDSGITSGKVKFKTKPDYF
jgi:hypothetical protein